jgi:phosphoglycolate phosphatase-like HAD superfamily hydrolase
MSDPGKPSSSSVIYALDFDGVLVDSASETGKSGLAAAKILFPAASWVLKLDTNEEFRNAVIARFCQVRSCLETGWEAVLLIKLLADPEEGEPSIDIILETFQSTLKAILLSKLGLNKDICNEALKVARNTWIARNNAKDWLDAHKFFEGACNAAKTLLHKEGNGNVYIITTKAKDYAQRLLEQKGLYSSSSENNESCLQESHIFGLGSGPKAEVLSQILQARPNQTIAIMVEDNLKTLDKIMAHEEIQIKTLPVLASWGYNTTHQQATAQQNHYMVLSESDSSSISQVLIDEASAHALFQAFQKKRGL